MKEILLSPPIAFLIILIFLLLLSYSFSKLAVKPTQKKEGSGTPYACGEDNYDPMAQPNYTNFFHFAFFFTIAHVAALIITTIPVETVKTFALAAVYVLGAIVGLSILLRR